MAAGGHFGWPKIFYFLDFVHKMAAGDHFGWPKITFDRISRHYRSIRNFYLFWFFSQNGCRFAPKNNRVLPLCVINGYAKYEVDRWIYETPQAFWAFLDKMATRGHFVFPIDAKKHRVLVIRDLNGYGEYEFDRCICDKVMACTSVGVRRRQRNQKHNITEIFKFRGYNYIGKDNRYVSLQWLLQQKQYKQVFEIYAIELLGSMSQFFLYDCTFKKQCTVPVTLTFDIWRSHFFSELITISVLYEFQIDKYRNMGVGLLHAKLKYVLFSSMAAILNISNCSRVATCHPPGIVHWDSIDE